MLYMPLRAFVIPIPARASSRMVTCSRSTPWRQCCPIVAFGYSEHPHQEVAVAIPHCRMEGRDSRT